MAPPKYPHIGLAGPMRSGKDTVADFLIREYGYSKMSFAGPLKEEVARGIGCRPKDLDEEPLRSQVRRVLQVWGTEFRRSQDRDYWVKQARKSIERRREQHPHIPLVFTDARFPNELAMLQAQGFLVICLDMPEHDVLSYLQSMGLPQEQIQEKLHHPSEQEWRSYPRFDYTIESRRGRVVQLLTDMKLVINAHTFRTDPSVL